MASVLGLSIGSSDKDQNANTSNVALSEGNSSIGTLITKASSANDYSSLSDWSGYIDPQSAFSGKQGASTVLGQISRAQWQDWLANTAPIITKLGEMATDPTYVTDAQEQATSAMNTSYENSRSGLALSQNRLGLSLSAEEQAVQDRKLGLSQAANVAKASNDAKIAAQDRQQAILAGASGISQELYDEATG